MQHRKRPLDESFVRKAAFCLDPLLVIAVRLQCRLCQALKDLIVLGETCRSRGQSDDDMMMISERFNNEYSE